MCDSAVALARATLGGGVLFAKNSDRQRNEAQVLERHPAAQHPTGATLATTYIAIPQAAETYDILISRPFWVWGAEMGANEHGVVIGNEAIYARLPASQIPALTGMDLVRLGLERARTAAEAVDIMTTLLEAHGQGGDCGHSHPHFYDNGFLIADPREAWVLETIGRFWVAARAGPLHAISNALSIGCGGRLSDGLRADARAAGLGDDPDIAAAYIDPVQDAVTVGRGRCARMTALLQRNAPRLTPAHMMAALRDHGPDAGAGWHPRDTCGRTLCMHAGEAERRGQTTASWVSELRPDGAAVHWVTATAAPCLSLFKPVTFETGVPAHGTSPRDRFNERSLWWRHERLHRAAVDGDFAAALAEIAPERDALEAAFAQRMEAASGEAVAWCWAEAEAAEARWEKRLRHNPRPINQAFEQSWAVMNETAGLPWANPNSP